MDSASQDLAVRLAVLERRLRRTQLAAGLAGILALTLGLGAWRAGGAQTGPATAADVIRARAFVVEDAAGRARVILGAPVPDPQGGVRRSAATGLVINDSAGFERFGLGLNADGSVAMGFDAAPVAGRQTNRERLTLAVSSSGNGEIRFLDRGSLVRAHMTLFDDNTVRLFLTDYLAESTIVHAVSARGDTVVVHRKR